MLGIRKAISLDALLIAHPTGRLISSASTPSPKRTQFPAARLTNQPSPEPLSYADAVRIRPPGIHFYSLGPHINAGSLY